MNEPSDSPTDAQLIDAINQGDVSAFNSLYLRYRDWTVQLALRFTGDRDLALDVLQEVFLYVLRKFPGFKLTAQFKTFLYPVVRHTAIALKQKSRRLTQSEFLDDVEAAAEPKQNTRADLATAMACLPESQREVLLLRFVDDLSLQEIALALQVPLGTVKSRLHNALEVLKNDPNTRKYFLP